MTIKKFRIDSGFTKLLDALTVNGCVALNVREEKKKRLNFTIATMGSGVEAEVICIK